jgi:hypothetical protein
MRVVQCTSKNALKFARLGSQAPYRKLYLDKTLLSTSCKLRYGAYFENTTVMCTVDVTCAWSNPITDIPDELLRGEAARGYLRSFLEPRVTSMTLTITPLFCKTRILPKRITFHADAINHLLEWDLDATICEGYAALNALLTELLLLIRLEKPGGDDHDDADAEQGNQGISIMEKYGLGDDEKEEEEEEEVTTTTTTTAAAAAAAAAVVAATSSREEGEGVGFELFVGGVFPADDYDQMLVNRRYPPSDDDRFLYSLTIQKRARGMIGRARFNTLKTDFIARRCNRCAAKIQGRWITRQARLNFISLLIRKDLERKALACTRIQRRVRGMAGRRRFQKHRDGFMRSLRITGDVSMKKGRLGVRVEYQRRGGVKDDWSHDWRLLIGVKKLWVVQDDTEVQLEDFKCKPFALDSKQIGTICAFLNEESAQQIFSIQSMRDAQHRQKVFDTLGHFLEVKAGTSGSGTATGGTSRPRSRSGSRGKSRSPDRPDRPGSSLSVERPGTGGSKADKSDKSGKTGKRSKAKRTSTSPDRGRAPTIGGGTVILSLKFREVLNL